MAGSQKKKEKMRIEHETSPGIALLIMRDGLFRGGPIMGDAGLNAVPLGGLGYFSEQAENTGAIMEFSWHGPIERETPYPPRVDTLYDQKPHRVFIPVGTTRNLFLDRIRLRDGYSWADCVVQYPIPLGLNLVNPRAWYLALLSRSSGWKSEQVDAISMEVATLSTSPKPIRIGRYLEPQR